MESEFLLNKKQKIPVFIIGCSLVAFFLTTTFVSGITALGPLYTCQFDPVVDGKIAADWALGKPRDVTLFDLANQANTMKVQVMSLWGNDYLLYYGITFAEDIDNFDLEDFMFLVFKTHEVNPIVEDPVTDGKFGKENDVKHMWFTNTTTDGYTTGVDFNWEDDPTNSGVENIWLGAVGNNGTHTMYEIAFPMDSGDANGFDLDANINGTAEFFIWYRDQSTGRDYTMIKQADADWDYMQQKICCSKSDCGPIPILYVVLGFIGITASASIIKRRRK
jgi:hypothetical protein